MLAVLGSLPVTAAAQSQPPLTPRDEAYWPTPEDRRAVRALSNVCMHVSNRTQGTSGVYRFAERFFEAAGLPVTDSMDYWGESPEVRRRIQQVWRRYEDVLVCESLQFDVPGGNVLKYAVSKKFTEFLEWSVAMQVPLNRVDPSDGRTVLDYVSYQLERERGSTVAVTLEAYYRLLREGGAKHRAELPPR